MAACGAGINSGQEGLVWLPVYRPGCHVGGGGEEIRKLWLVGRLLNAGGGRTVWKKTWMSVFSHVFTEVCLLLRSDNLNLGKRQINFSDPDL